MLEKGNPEAEVLFQLDVKRVNEKLLEKKAGCTAGVTMGMQGWPRTGFGDALLQWAAPKAPSP